MPHIVIQITANKSTTRDGTHPDDIAYIEQVKGHFEMKLDEYGFGKHVVDVKMVEELDT